MEISLSWGQWGRLAREAGSSLIHIIFGVRRENEQTNEWKTEREWPCLVSVPRPLPISGARGHPHMEAVSMLISQAAWSTVVVTLAHKMTEWSSIFYIAAELAWLRRWTSYMVALLTGESAKHWPHPFTIMALFKYTHFFIHPFDWITSLFNLCIESY